MRLQFLLLLLFAAVVGGCSEDNTPTTPSPPVAFTRTDLRAGTGTEAVAGNIVSVHYTGWFYNAAQPDQKGAQFDSSAGGEVFRFRLGAGQVIAGWDQGIVGMRVGGIRRLIIPPSLGYGDFRNGPIPPNASLLFDIELLDVQAAQ